MENEKLKEAGLRVIHLFDTVEDALEDKKIDMGEWFQIGNAGISTAYIFQNAAEIKNSLLLLTGEGKDELILYWKENANVGVDDDEIYQYVIDCVSFIYDTFEGGKELVERGKELFSKE